MTESRAGVAVVVMGVAGCGKSTVADALATRIGGAFIDADQLHSADSVAKMAAGHPLTDDDRAPWLQRVGHRIADEAAAGRRAVVACSALRRVYRDALRADAGEPLFFVHLHGSRDTLAARMAARPGHFMPVALLDSQLATLEPLDADELGWRADIEESVHDIVADAAARINKADS